ncbi:MAG TPA: NAD(P)-binding protein, partial [Anaerovoracaceae bacterium]|nr:NAD(P)-binding protein [Anaerovoracaceae bacterium]
MGEIRININNKEIVVADEKNILQIALENNIEIPHLCYDERIKPYGACGLCVVEIEGSPKLQRACSTKPFDGMVIKTDTKRIRDTRKAALKLLCSDHRGDCRPPCMLACPGKTDCQGYVGLIANGEYKEALKLTKENIPLPASIGRVCPHPCETACRRQLVEEPVSIAQLKSFIADMDLENETYIPEVKSSTGKKVAVIGAGPAGLSCAYYLTKEGHSVDIFEAMPKPGGMLRYGIPQYRLPKEVLDKEIEVIIKMGVNIKYNTKVGRDVSLDFLRKEYSSVFLGIGAWESSKLGCIGEDSEGVFGGIDFLIKVASNENVTIGKKVIVVGGGNTAMDVCRTAVRLGAEEVKVLYRRTREEMPAEVIEIEEAEEEGVQFEFLVAPTEVITRDGKVYGIECQKMMLGEPDASGRRKPVPVPGEKVIFEADMIISAIGQKINSSGLSEISTTKWGTLAVNEETYMTSVDGIFAGGDAVTGPGIAIAAIGHGRECADLINSYLNGVVKKSSEPLYVKQNDITQKDFADRTKDNRVKIKVVPAEIRKHNFAEINSILTEEEARRESSRCLECGCGDYFECQLYKYINEYNVDPGDLNGEKPKHVVKDEHPFIERNQDKCILCGLCIRACDEVMGVGALGLVKRGFDSVVEPEFGMDLKDSSCVSCGNCINVCPTGACIEKTNSAKQ